MLGVDTNGHNQVNNESQVLLTKLQEFFANDYKIKEEMIRIAPPVSGDNTMAVSYADTLYKGVKDILFRLKTMNDSFNLNHDLEPHIQKLLSSMQKDLIDCGADLDQLRTFYKKYISNMSPEFVTAVKQEFVVANFFNRKFGGSIPYIKTLNEYLHYMHTGVMSSNMMMQQVPVIKARGIEEESRISLRGQDSLLGEELYNKYPREENVDIISLSANKVILMLRDYGHFSTIELSVGPKETLIEYYIPKICDVNMVNNLPGVSKVAGSGVGTTGRVTVENEKLIDYLCNEFIPSMPKDGLEKNESWKI